MSGWTDLPGRLMAKSYGAGLVFTEMVSAVGLSRKEPKTCSLVRSHPAERPLVVQIFGRDPQVLARAACLLEEAGAEAVDLNLGCPARKVVRQGAGAALLKTPDLVREIFSQVRRAGSLTLSAKLRSGFSPQESPAAVGMARMAEGEGLDGLALHPRFARQGFGGAADWSLLARTVKAVSIPVLGSGDVIGPESARQMLEKTSCAGVMLGRAALGRPWIFEEIGRHLAGQEARPAGPAQVQAAIRRHLGLLIDYAGRRTAWLKFKGWAGWYLRGLPQARTVRRAVHSSRGVEEMEAVLDKYFQEVGQEARG